jgi:hypothetical protein
MTQPMMAYGGNNLMNLVVSKVYASQRNRFKGSGRSGGFAYTFDVTETPVAKLIPNKTTHNFEIDMKKVAITVKGGIINFDKTLPMKATGKFAINRSQLSLTQLKVSTGSTSAIDQVVVGIIDSQIIPKISTALAGIPIPQLTNVFGSGLSASLQSGNVRSGPALEVGARIAGKGNVGAADTPAAATIASLNNGTAANALMGALVSGGAVNVLMKAGVASLSHAFDERGSKAGFGAGIKGTIRATTPVLGIRNGKGSVSTTISFSGLKGGIRVPIKGWSWVSLPAPKTNVVITNSLSASGRTGTMTLTGVQKLSVSLRWPKVLKPVEAVVKRLLNGILSLFRGKISNAVKGKKFELFTLPSRVPGTNLGASLSFAPRGLTYFKSSVQALVRIRT